MDHVTRATTLLGMVSCPNANTWHSLHAHKIGRLWLLLFQRYFRECEMLEWVTWLWPRPLRGQLVIYRLVLLVAKSCTKPEVCSFSLSEDIFMGCKILKLITWPWPRPFQGQLCVRRLTLDIACKHTKLDDSSFSRSRDISGGVKLCNASRGPGHAHLGYSWSFGG